MTSAIDLHALRREHGGMVYDGGRRWIGPGPGHSRRDASLSVMVCESGRPVVHSFAGDPFPACAQHLGLEMTGAPMNPRDVERARRERGAQRRRRAAEDQAFCAAVWAGAVAHAGTAAEAYLWSRGLIYDGDDLRFHAAAPRSRTPSHGRTGGALVALVRNAAGQPTGLHLTYLTPDGRKAFGDRSRLMFGAISGGAVQLAPIGRDGVLAVGEGIETSGAFSMLHGVTTWAALSTSGLQTFVPPPRVRKLLIAADSDDGGAGLRAATILAERARRLCAVEIRPAPEGLDWADVAVAHG
jgi:putative DNA primase/helicase